MLVLWVTIILVGFCFWLLRFDVYFLVFLGFADVLAVFVVCFVGFAFVCLLFDVVL